MDWKLELIAVPVSDIDRAKAFYVDQVGFNADHDIPVNDDLRFVQLTPPGSACSIVLDVTMTDMPPGLSAVSRSWCPTPTMPVSISSTTGGRHPVEDLPWGRFTYFADPDGNTWALQQLVPSRRETGRAPYVSPSEGTAPRGCARRRARPRVRPAVGPDDVTYPCRHVPLGASLHSTGCSSSAGPARAWSRGASRSPR
ncbi:hypothetical protein NKG05_11565 [Oerskovia sp. M15]